MSNPSVIVLASLRNASPSIRRLDIEDNIGESIHVHWNNFRFDLSIKEFLLISREIAAAQRKICESRGYALTGIDPLFLILFADLLPNIIDISIETRRIGNLRALVHRRIRRLGSYVIPCHLSKAPAYQYLQGEPENFLRYHQESYHGDSNEWRLLRTLDSINANGYPYQDNYITLFGDQGYIRDGQHRAAILASLYGFNYEVPVRVIKFKGGAWRLSCHTSDFSYMSYAFAKKLKNSLSRLFLHRLSALC